VYRYVDVALYVGKNNRSYFEAHGFKKEELAWVPHAVENERFAEARGAEREAAQWRREIGIPKRAPVILFAGKLGSEKAPDILLDAFLSLEDELAHLVIVGSGPMQEELKARAGNHPRAHFLGFQNQSRMPVVYRLGSIFVMPSRRDTWGLAVNEAMACGRPVIVSSKVGCAPDLVDHDNGAIVSPNDPAALRDAIDSLLSDADELRRLGRNSAERIKKWSIENAASCTAEAIKSVVSPDAERSQASA
jgi:glycosyltransferase involved in cell wall biosynthesis